MRIPGPVNALKLRRKVHVSPMNWQEHTAEEHVIFAVSNLKITDIGFNNTQHIYYVLSQTRYPT